MPHGRNDAERRAGERSAKLGDQFLERVFLRSVRARQVAVESRAVTTGMSEFVQRGAVPVDWLEIGGRRRHLHIILRRDIEGATATDTELDACRLDQRLHAWLDRAGRWWRGDRRNLFRETIALVDVEDREALEEWNCLRFLAGLGCAFLLVIGNEAVSIDNGCAVLTLPDMAAHRQRLAEGEPTLSREAVLDDRAPEDQDVEPLYCRLVAAFFGMASGAFAAAVPQG